MSTPDLEFLGAILTHQIASSQAADNAVIANLEDKVNEWKQAYSYLFQAVARANETVDSLRIENILTRAEYTAERAETQGVYS